MRRQNDEMHRSHAGRSLPASATRRRGGFVALLILVAVAILAILMTMDLKRVFRGGEGRPVGPRTVQPWQQADLLAPDDVFLDLPEPPQPSLDQPRTVSAAVTSEGNPRGVLTLRFDIHGRLTAEWQAEYTSAANDRILTADLAGNIDVDQHYATEDGASDPARLFFIARGPYAEHVYNPESGYEADFSGDAWITGWLRPDNTVHGRLVLTRDEKTGVTLDFAGGAP